MTNITDKLRQVRKDYLNALTTESDAVLLRQQLTDLAALHPDLFGSYEHSAGVEPVDTNTSNWSKDYFSRQKMYAASNFSRKRVEHLIELRAHLWPSTQQHESKKPAPLKPAARTDAGGGFTPSANLAKFVEQNDLPKARTALQMELDNSNLDSAALRAATQWAKEHIPRLFEPFQEKAFARGINTDSAKWDGDYFRTQLVFLNTNFSEQRFHHLIEVREHNRRKQAPAPARPAQLLPQPSPARAARSDVPRSLPPAPHPTAQHVKDGSSALRPLALLVGGVIAGIATVIYIIRKYT